MTTPEFEAIRCMVDISVCGLTGASVEVVVVLRLETYRPQLGGFLADRASDGRALHFTLGVDDLSVPC